MTASPQEDRFIRVYLAVGRVALSWAYIDNLLDYCNVLLDNKLDGHQKNKERPRTALSSKICFFVGCLNNGNPALDGSRPTGVELAKKIKVLSDERHWLIHGAADLVSDQRTVLLTKLAKLEGPATLEERIVTIEDIEKFAYASEVVGSDLAQFLHGLLEMFRDEINNLGKLPR